MIRRALRIAMASGAFMLMIGRASAGVPIIKTVAGGGPTDIPALSANLASPVAVVVAPSGDVFVAAPDQHRVFRVGSSGQLTVFAGNGNNGYNTEDGVAAVSTSLRRPSGLALDSEGNLFVADGLTVRKIDSSTGIITTVAGSGNYYSPLGDGGPATSARLDARGLAVDNAGNLFIADGGDQRVRRVDARSGIITSVVGSSDYGDFSGDGGPAAIASLNTPLDVAFDGGGNLFIVDSGNRRIRRVDAITGIITTVAGRGTYGSTGDGGPAIDASFYFLESVEVSQSGDLFIADSGNRRVHRVDADTGIITTVAGNGVYPSPPGDGGPATSASLGLPRGIALDLGGNLFIADAGSNRIRRVDGATGIISSIAGNGSASFSGDGERATRGALADPVGVTVDRQGNIFIADQGARFQGSNASENHRIRRVDAATGVMSTVAGSNAGFGGDGGAATAARINLPAGVAVNSEGDVFIADYGNNRIRKVEGRTGVISTVAGDGCYCFKGDGGPATSAGVGNPTAIALDSTGNLFIADRYAARIRRVDATTGIITTVAGTGPGNFSGGDGRPAMSTSLWDPVGLAVDGQANLFVAELGINRVRRIDAITGIITTVAGAGSGGDGGPAVSARLIRPDGIAVNHAGDVFISDLYHVRRVDAATGIISSIAGGDDVGFRGEGTPANEALLHQPMGLAMDPSGNLLVVDKGNGRVRKIRFSNQSPLALAAATDTVECTSPSGATLTLDGTGSGDPDSLPGTRDDITAYEWFVNFGSPAERFLGSGEILDVTLPLGNHEVTLRVVDSFGEESSSQVVVRVVDTSAPDLLCPASATKECAVPGGAEVDLGAAASDVCGGPIVLRNDRTSDPDASGFYPLGITAVTYTATDAFGNSSSCATSVNVLDTKPPEMAAGVGPAVLWPPNRRMVNVQATVSANDVCSPSEISLVSIASSEPDDPTDVRDWTDDIQGAIYGTADLAFLLRAERRPNGSGRTYVVTYRAEDAAGNASEAASTVVVPHDWGGLPKALRERIGRRGETRVTETDP